VASDETNKLRLSLHSLFGNQEGQWLWEQHLRHLRESGKGVELGQKARGDDMERAKSILDQSFAESLAAVNSGRKDLERTESLLDTQTFEDSLEAVTVTRAKSLVGLVEPTALYSAGELARVLQVSEKTIRRWLRASDLMGVKAGGQWRIRGSSVLRFLERSCHV
jgi:DNA binding domain, excisionase family